MAGLKKPSKRDATNPNTALVLFLVFFVLLSIGLGVWGYFGYSGQEKLRTEAKEKVNATKAAQLGEEYAKFYANDTLLALGLTLEPDEKASWDSANKANVLGDGGKFKGEKTSAAIKKMIDDNRAELGFDSAYKNSYRGRHKELTKSLEKTQADLSAAEGKLKKEEDRNNALEAQYKAKWDKALADIADGNKKALDAALAKTAEFEDARKKFVDIQSQLKKIGDAHLEEVKILNAKLNVLAAKLKKAEKAAAAASESIVRTRTEPHALFLDISTGKALWDDPLGKITLVDNKARLVTINIGSAHGVKPELAFNVFASGWKKRGEGIIKGTIEVIRILGPNASVARITSLYDASGTEIVLNDGVRGRILREAENPLKEGDLIFNMAFGNHVVVAGNVNWLGSPGDTAAEHMRNLKDFMHILGRQGVIVDAYLDLSDGKLHGAVTNKTRYLILGKGMPKPVDLKAPVSEQAKKINAAIAEIRADAVERGMFVISADNFANVIGYRRPRSANDTEPSAADFKPGLPSGGSHAP